MVLIEYTVENYCIDKKIGFQSYTRIGTRITGSPTNNTDSGPRPGRIFEKKNWHYDMSHVDKLWFVE